MCTCTLTALKGCKGQFFCGSDDADRPCVDKSKICDGINDCPNRRDEMHCGKSKKYGGNNDCSNRVSLRLVAGIMTAPTALTNGTVVSLVARQLNVGLMSVFMILSLVDVFCMYCYIVFLLT